MKYSILSGINRPEDIKKLNKSDIRALALEIREFLIENVSRSGGHLASNLGVVEMTLAIHSVFNSPIDHIIFDVGHQSYVHKLITGRRIDFATLRTPGGLSGFTLSRESEHDPFGAGHSSTSISAALGMAQADVLAGRECHTVCVTGDGAFTGGMIHEALNNINSKLPLVIILNENGMSISSNSGTFASYLSNLDHHKPNYFEQLGISYIGPIDGNDYLGMCDALTEAKKLAKACLVHIKTKKGRGYSLAETSPDNYHNITPTDCTHTFHSAFAEKLTQLAETNDNVLAVTAAMGIGTGLNIFGEKYPDRYFDVGIAEPHALTFAAGLAAGGFMPFVAIYSTFLQRGYDNLLHDIALQKLPVKIMIDRAGLAVSDGATHHGIFDVAFISHIPEMMLFAPISYHSLKEMTEYSLGIDVPLAIRYSNCAENLEPLKTFKLISSKPECRVSCDFDTQNPPSHIFITYGSIYEKVTCAKAILQKNGVDAGIILVETLKPYSGVASAISKIISKAKRVLYVEEGIRYGGAGEITREELIKAGVDMAKVSYDVAAIEDNFASPSELCDLYDYVGLSEEKIAKRMIN